MLLQKYIPLSLSRTMDVYTIYHRQRGRNIVFYLLYLFTGFILWCLLLDPITDLSDGIFMLIAFPGFLALLLLTTIATQLSCRGKVRVTIAADRLQLNFLRQAISRPSAEHDILFVDIDKLERINGKWNGDWLNINEKSGHRTTFTDRTVFFKKAIDLQPFANKIQLAYNVFRGASSSSTPQQAVNAGTDQKIPSVSLPVEKSPVRPVQNEKAIGRFKRLLYLLTGIYLVLCLAAMAAIALNKWDRPTENMLKLLWIAGVFSGVVMIRIFISKYAARHPEMRDADAGPKKY